MRWKNKIKAIEGDGFWHIKDSRLRLSDGPHGVRKETPHGTERATCFPTASAIASSWDENIAALVGESLGTECVALDVDVLLGPGVNLQRHPACGRNFEYFGEDPLLSGKMAAAYIRGVQSRKVAATLKHFALNSQETERFVSDSIVDERALRELYLLPFEIAVREGDPWAVMTSYNRFEGQNTGENKRLFGILREEWRYGGCVMSDWGSVEDRLSGLEAGMDLEMPGGSSPSGAFLATAYRRGILDEDLLDRSLAHIRGLEKRAGSAKGSSHLGHYETAVLAAIECMVLLKNDGGLLPLNPAETVMLAGAVGETQVQGLGSSRVEPLITTTPLAQWQNSRYSFSIAQESSDARNSRESCDVREGRGVCNARNARDGRDARDAWDADDARDARDGRVCLYFAKLPTDAEGYDRQSLELTAEDRAEIARLKDRGLKIVLILQTGAPLILGDVPADAILLMHYAGEGAYEALQSILYGVQSPSGRLCASWPLSREDIPSEPYYLKYPRQAQYRESVFVGYRYYTTFDRPVAYPFGYGLTYGRFLYERMEAERIGDSVYVTVRLTNTGKRRAKEVVQIYVACPGSSLLRPFIELKAWEKAELQSGETRELVLKIPFERLRSYTPRGEKIFENGQYYFLCGPNCRDFTLSAGLVLEADSAHGGTAMKAANEVAVAHGGTAMKAANKVASAHGGNRIVARNEAVAGEAEERDTVIGETSESSESSAANIRRRHLLFAGLTEEKGIPAIYKTMNRPVTEEEFERLLGRRLPDPSPASGVDAPLSALRGPLRPLFHRMAIAQADAMPGDRELNRQAVLSMPLRALSRLSGGKLSPRLLRILVWLGRL